MKLPFALRAVSSLSAALVMALAASATGAVAPANDNIAQAHMIDTVFEGTRYEANTTGATLEPNEPPGLDYIPIEATVWYVVKFSAYRVSVNTFGSDFDTILCAYSPASNGQLFPVTSCNDDSIGNGYASEIWFDVVPGKAYYIQAGGFNGDTGNLVLNFGGVATGNYLPLDAPL